MVMPIITPDLAFVEHIIRNGGESVKKCFQCANCSVVCSITPNDRPFPRKEMRWAQWGLKERLFSDPDIWLCNRCIDCSTYCPRGAKPGDVLAAIRNYSIIHFALPNFLAKRFSRLRYLLFVLAILIFLYLLPITDLQIAFWILLGLAIAVTATGGMRFWENISRFQTGSSVETQIKRGFLTSFVSSLVEILKHSNFRKCGVNKGSFLPHFILFYGAICLVISHIGTQLYAIPQAMLPLPLTNPIKIIGIIGSLLLFSGLTLIIYRRLFRKDEEGKATYFDWFFVVLLYLATITGIATGWLRIFEIAWLHWFYLAHLVFSFTLLAYAPFSKLAHLLYRTLAMTYAKQIGREAATKG